jgi:hypothetical protein
MTLSAAAPSPLDEFKWERQPQAERFVRDELLGPFLGGNGFALELAKRMKEETGTRFQDWVDTIVISTPASDLVQSMRQCGYELFNERAGEQLWVNRLGMFPRIGVKPSQGATQVHIKVDSVSDFADVWRIQSQIEGEPLAPYRRVCISREAGGELWASERWGWIGLEVLNSKHQHAAEHVRTLESFLTRKRDFDDDAEAYAHAERLIDASPLPTDIKCALFFEAERRYWQRRNRAAQVQKGRQDKLGLGWGNHDHHTYRCSRRTFRHLVRVWEKLGFHCRERFYAGREAGWGAQVMEQPNANIITFNDVDLTPDELMGDFSHDGLAERDRLGTVGLWCALHGDSFSQAGMHHLEAQFDFDSLVEQLAKYDVKTMKPFTNFAFLRQAFTEGERWTVEPKRIDRLVAQNLITGEQAAKFRAEGAIGSHLENLERNEGFKGFNQTGVSEIIAATDPRKQHLS